MSVMGHLNRAVKTLDTVCSKIQLRLGERRGGLITIFVHNLFLDTAEIERNLACPQQCLTVAQLERAINYFQSVGYRFVSPVEIIAGLAPKGRHVLLTFDDGYFNNLRALPLMESYAVPALFFVPARMIQDGTAYWWDELYRTRRGQGCSHEEAGAEIHPLAMRPTEEVMQQLAGKLGVREFRAVTDVDRLFSPQELRAFAAHPLVFIGNHGCLHEYLPAYPEQEARRAISEAQQLIHEMTGKPPLAIAYPVGAYSEQIIQFAKDAGLRLGFGTDARKEYVPKLGEDNRAMRLGRHTLWGVGAESIEAQCEYMRSDLGLHCRYRTFMEQLKQRVRRVRT